MVALFVVALFAIAFGAVVLQFLLTLRTLGATKGAAHSCNTLLTADRYRPMLRLLSDDDMAFVSANRKLASGLRARRRQLFRAYLRCLTRDYSQLLASVRQAMVLSGVDRPDLARALATNRLLFAMAICKVEFRLTLHAAGFGTIDVSGLVHAVEALRGQVRVLSTATPLAA
jgi:hypothetical protein